MRTHHWSHYHLQHPGQYECDCVPSLISPLSLKLINQQQHWQYAMRHSQMDFHASRLVPCTAIFVGISLSERIGFMSSRTFYITRWVDVSWGLYGCTFIEWPWRALISQTPFCVWDCRDSSSLRPDSELRIWVPQTVCRISRSEPSRIRSYLCLSLLRTRFCNFSMFNPVSFSVLCWS